MKRYLASLSLVTLGVVLGSLISFAPTVVAQKTPEYLVLRVNLKEFDDYNEAYQAILNEKAKEMNMVEVSDEPARVFLTR